MCPLKAVVDLSFCECSVFGSCKKSVFSHFHICSICFRFCLCWSLHSPAESALNSFQLSSILFRLCDFRRLFFSGLGTFGFQYNTVNKGTVWNFCTKTSLKTQSTPGVRE